MPSRFAQIGWPGAANASALFVFQDPLPDNMVALMQDVWAANGNIISRQYAGTDAMKVRSQRLSLARVNGMESNLPTLFPLFPMFMRMAFFAHC